MATDRGVAHAARAVQGHIRHAVTVQQAGESEPRRVQRRAIDFICVQRGHQQAGGAHRHRAVAVTNGVIRQADAAGTARVDRVTADRRVAHAARAAQGHVRHAVTVQQSGDCKPSWVHRRPVSLVRVQRGDQQARRSHRQCSVVVINDVVAQAHARRADRGNRVATRRRIAGRTGAAQIGVRHAVAIQQS